MHTMSRESSSLCDEFGVCIGNFGGNNAKDKIKNAVLNQFKAHCVCCSLRMLRIHVCIDFCWYMLYFSVSLYILYLSMSVRLFIITVLVKKKRMYIRLREDIDVQRVLLKSTNNCLLITSVFFYSAGCTAANTYTNVGKYRYKKNKK